MGGRRPFHDLSVGEAAAPLAGECGGGKTPPQISRRKDQAGSLGTEEKTSWPSYTLSVMSNGNNNVLFLLVISHSLNLEEGIVKRSTLKMPI